MSPEYVATSKDAADERTLEFGAGRFIFHEGDLGTEMYIIHEGRVRQGGSPEEVFRRPNSEFVARFVRSENVLRGRARAGGRLVRFDRPAGAWV